MSLTPVATVITGPIYEVREEFESVSLLGFSQGMAVATSLLRREPQAYACVVGLSGFAIDPTMAPGAESATPEAGVVPSEVSGAGPLAGFFDDEAVKAVGGAERRGVGVELRLDEERAVRHAVAEVAEELTVGEPQAGAGGAGRGRDAHATTGRAVAPGAGR